MKNWIVGALLVHTLAFAPPVDRRFSNLFGILQATTVGDVQASLGEAVKYLRMNTPKDDRGDFAILTKFANAVVDLEHKNLTGGKIPSKHLVTIAGRLLARSSGESETNFERIQDLNEESEDQGRARSKNLAEVDKAAKTILGFAARNCQTPEEYVEYLTQLEISEENHFTNHFSLKEEAYLENGAWIWESKFKKPISELIPKVTDAIRKKIHDRALLTDSYWHRHVKHILAGILDTEKITRHKIPFKLADAESAAAYRRYIDAIKTNYTVAGLKYLDVEPFLKQLEKMEKGKSPNPTAWESLCAWVKKALQ